MMAASSVACSRWEPVARVEHLFTTSGRSRMRSIVVERRHHVWSINYLVTANQLHAGRLAVADYLSRRALQLLLATRRAPGQPWFVGRDVYMEHMDSSLGRVRAPEFKKHVMKHQKAGVVVLMQHRWMRNGNEAEW